ERAGCKEVETVQLLFECFPFNLSGLRAHFDCEPLEGFIKLADRFVLIDPLKALQSLEFETAGFGNGVSKLRLAAPGRSFKQDGFIQSGSQVDNRSSYRISNVAD